MASEQLGIVMRESQALAERFVHALVPSIDLVAMRRMVREMAPRAALAPGVTITPVRVAGCAAEWLSAADADPDRRLLYLHGGGYVAGDIESYRPLASHIAHATGCSVLLLDYRLAPEHRFDAPLADALAAFAWLGENGPHGPAAASALFVGGDSAGGGLTLSTLYALRDGALPLPRAAFPLCAALDLSRPFEVMPKEHQGPLIAMTRLFTGDADATNPVISPLYGKLQGLPPLLMQVGGAEPGLVANVRFEERARAAGVQVELEIWPEMPHVWHMHAPFLPEANRAIERIGVFVRQFG